MKKTFIVLFTLAAAMFAACNNDEEPTPLSVDFAADATNIAAGTKVQFTDISAGNPTRWNWTFEGGTPATSEVASPEVTYNEPGTYSVTLKIGRGNDEAETIRQDMITVGYPDEIAVDFSASKVLVSNVEEVTFTDKSTGFPTSWLWTFTPEAGTPVTSTEQNPKITFETPGVYSVTLKVSNPKAENTKTVANYITVIDYLTVAADFTAVSRRTSAGNAIQFNNASVGIGASYQWEFEGGTPATSTEENPVITYAAAGRYKVKLTVNNDYNSNSKEIADFVAVIPSENMVLYLPLDGSVNDAGPNAIVPVIRNVGEGTLTYVPNGRGALQTAYFVDKSGTEPQGGFLSIPDNNHVDGTKAYTVAFWNKTANTTDVQFIFQHGRGTKNFPAFEGQSNGYGQTWFRHMNGSQKYRFVIEYTGGPGNWTDGTTHMGDGEWHHYVCVCVIEANTNQSTYVYIDGVKKVEALNKGFKPIFNKPYTIGATHVFTTAQPTTTDGLPPYLPYSEDNFNGYLSFKEHLNGELSDFVHYGRALSETEITELYNLTKEQ